MYCSACCHINNGSVYLPFEVPRAIPMNCHTEISHAIASVLPLWNPLCLSACIYVWIDCRFSCTLFLCSPGNGYACYSTRPDGLQPRSDICGHSHARGRPSGSSGGNGRVHRDVEAAAVPVHRPQPRRPLLRVHIGGFQPHCLMHMASSWSLHPQRRIPDWHLPFCCLLPSCACVFCVCVCACVCVSVFVCWAFAAVITH